MLHMVKFPYSFVKICSLLHNFACCFEDIIFVFLCYYLRVYFLYIIILFMSYFMSIINFYIFSGIAKSSASWIPGAGFSWLCISVNVELRLLSTCYILKNLLLSLISMVIYLAINLIILFVLFNSISNS